jgi:hypothetical protein
MPRDANGNWTPPAGNPVVNGTTIDASWWNAMLSDLQNEISNSLARQGLGAGIISATLKAANGDIGSPPYSFLSDLSTGWFLNAAGDLRFTISGQAMLKLTNNLAMRVLGLGPTGANAAGLEVDTQYGISNSTPIQTWKQNGVQKAALLGNGALTLGGSSNPSDAARRVDLTRDVVSNNGIGAGWASMSPGSYTLTAAYADVPGLTPASILTTGGPVLVLLTSDGSGSDSYFSMFASTGSIQFMRDGARIAGFTCNGANASFTQIGQSFVFLDVVGAGNHTYKVQAKGLSGTTPVMQNYMLMLRELI